MVVEEGASYPPLATDGAQSALFTDHICPRFQGSLLRQVVLSHRYTPPFLAMPNHSVTRDIFSSSPVEWPRQGLLSPSLLPSWHGRWSYKYKTWASGARRTILILPEK